MTACDPSADLRKMSAEQLERLGQESLREHLIAQGMVAHVRYGALEDANLEAFLLDLECVRHPVRLVFELGEMAFHQFAQPEIDWRNTAQDGRVLYLRPGLRGRADLIRLAVAYMIPVINYGGIVSDGHCLSYGATLLGMTEEEYYQKVCALSDLVGAQSRLEGQQAHC